MRKGSIGDVDVDCPEKERLFGVVDSLRSTIGCVRKNALDWYFVHVLFHINFALYNATLFHVI